jgi:hypothetical protein
MPVVYRVVGVIQFFLNPSRAVIAMDHTFCSCNLSFSANPISNSGVKRIIKRGFVMYANEYMPLAPQSSQAGIGAIIFTPPIVSSKPA